MNKKYILGLGTLAMVAAPVAAIVSCGKDKETKKDEGDKGKAENKGGADPSTSSGDGSTTTTPEAFDFATDLTKFKDVTSTKEKADLKDLSGAKTPEELGITNPELSTDVSATYNVDSTDDKGVLTVTVTLAKTGIDSPTGNTKTIKVTPKTKEEPQKAFDFKADLDKFEKEVTSTKADLQTLVKGPTNEDELGINVVSGLTDGVTATYKITKVDKSKGEVWVTVTLAKADIANPTGNTKEITVMMPKLETIDLAQEVTKLNDFKSTDDTKSTAAVLAQGATDVKAKFEAIQGYKAPTLSDGVSISKVVVKTALATDKVVYTVTLTHGDKTEDKDVTVTFAVATPAIDLTQEVAKLKDFKSTDDTKSTAAVLAQGATDVKAKFEAIQGYKAPTLSDGVSISKVVVKTALATDKVVYTVTLTHGDKTEDKDVTVTFAVATPAIDLTQEVTKLNDFKSTDDTKSTAAVLAQGATDVKAKFEAIQGYKAPTLSDGVSISKVVVKTALATDKVVYTVTLTHGDKTEDKDVTVTFAVATPAIDLTQEVTKLNDFKSTDDTKSTAAVLAQGATDVKAKFEAIQGYKAPTLSDGVSISKVVVKTALATDKVVYTVTLTHGDKTEDKDVTVTFAVATPAIDLTQEVTKLNDFKSTDDTKSTAAVLAQGATDVKAKFEAIQGYKAPTLSDGVSISKVVVKTALATDKVVYTVTLTHGDKTEDKDVTVTFAVATPAIDLTQEVTKLNDFKSTDDTKSTAAVLAQGATDVKAKFEAIQGYKAPTLSDGVSISKVVVKTALATDKVVYTVTLTHGDKTEDKDVTVTFAVATPAIDLTQEVTKLNDFKSTDDTKSTAAVLAQGATDVKAKFEAIQGYKAPTLSDGVSISKVVVKTALATDKVVYTVTLTHGDKTEDKDVTVTFAAAAPTDSDSASTQETHSST